MSWREAAKKELKDLGLTQEDLAQMMGAAPPHLSSWLTGKRNIPIAWAVMMARVFGWTQKQFLEYFLPEALKLPEYDDDKQGDD